MPVRNNIDSRDVLTIPVKILLFLLSYVPLYIIVIVLNHANNDVVWFFSGLTIIVLLAFLAVYMAIRNVSGTYSRVENVENINKINVEYIVTYLLPFLNVNFNDVFSDIAVLIIFFIIGFIYVNSDMLYTNPTLNLLTFSVYKCKVNNLETIIISREDRSDLNRKEVIQIGSNIYIGK
ncbi:MAG: hypothetical protein M1504_00640 [Candidatus Marsarchaeota archaeon]|nr:hypothetical protein [Candidatus Marsarchaeota archaeon]